jgi:hypothetical protein
MEFTPPKPTTLKAKATDYQCISLPIALSVDHHAVRFDPIVDSKYVCYAMASSNCYHSFMRTFIMSSVHGSS